MDIKDSYRVTAFRGQLMLAMAEVQKETADTREGDPAEAGFLLTGVMIGLGVADAILKGRTATEALDAVMGKAEDALEEAVTQHGKAKSNG